MRISPPRCDGRGKARAGLAFLLLGACALAGCREVTAPDVYWPAGALLVAERAALDALAHQAEGLAGTPLAAAARTLRDRMPACAQVEAHAPSGDIAELVTSLRCSSGALAEVERARGESGLLFAAPTASPERLIGRVDLSGRDVAVRLDWEPGETPGPAALLVPGTDAAGRAQLSDRDALLHVRVRTQDGIDLARLTPPDSQADRLFKLRAAVFSSAVLSGTWEAAAYLPAVGSEMPRVAVALDVRSTAVALASARRFVESLGEHWQLGVQPFALGALAGGCLHALRLMPELTPCYVVTERALVIGWNADSLRHALGLELAQPPGPGTESAHMSLELSRFAEADARLSQQLPTHEQAPPLDWPWRRVMASARRQQDGRLQVDIALESAVGS